LLEGVVVKQREDDNRNLYEGGREAKFLVRRHPLVNAADFFEARSEMGNSLVFLLFLLQKAALQESLGQVSTSEPKSQREAEHNGAEES
jgi:hypothetical protein